MDVWFDSTLKCRSGKRIPYWEDTTIDEAKDKDLVWFHEGYGLMALYRLHIVDEKNAIAEKLNKWCRTSSSRWEELSDNPELALQD